jgi:hypothetical protein
MPRLSEKKFAPPKAEKGKRVKGKRAKGKRIKVLASRRRKRENRIRKIAKG